MEAAVSSCRTRSSSADRFFIFTVSLKPQFLLPKLTRKNCLNDRAAVKVHLKGNGKRLRLDGKKDETKTESICLWTGCGIFRFPFVIGLGFRQLGIAEPDETAKRSKPLSSPRRRRFPALPEVLQPFRPPRRFRRSRCIRCRTPPPLHPEVL